MYQDSFGLRLGYFNEADDKGARKFLALGAGFKFSTINVDLSYLFSTAKNFQSPWKVLYVSHYHLILEKALI